MTPSASSTPAQAKYAFGPFVLDVGNRRLLRDDAPVGITARVFDVLVVLVERSGRVIDKDTLIARVWGDVAVEEGNLARAVSTLRKVLGDSPDDPRFIVTLPGRGYQFIAIATPIEADASALSPELPRRARRAWIPLAAAAVLVTIAAALVWMRDRAVALAPPRIVVLPFKNLGPAADEYVSAGITEEITSRLAAVGALRVVSRTTAQHYDRSGKGAREIGADLGADYLLEGSLLWDRSPRDNAERVRITAQLIRVADDDHVWAETFDRGMDDLFAVQSELAVRVVRELRATVLGSERAALLARPTENLQAYRCYLQGLFYARRPDFSEEGMVTAIRHLQRAADLDPRFAHAQAALALAHLSFYQFGHDTSPDRLELARAALERAKQAGPQLPETARAEVRYWLAVRPDRAQALAAIAAAERQAPRDADVAVGAASIFLRLGEWEEAARQLRRGRELEPKNPFVHAQMGLVMAGLRRYGDAQGACEQSLLLEPDQQLAYIARTWINWLWRGDLAATRRLVNELPQPDDWRFMELRFLQAIYERRFGDAIRVTEPWAERWMRTWVLVRPAVLLEAQARGLAGDTAGAKARFETARTLLESEIARSPGDGRLRSSLAIAYAGLGRRAEAERSAGRALELMPYPTAFDTSVVREDVALAYTMIGDHEAALEQIRFLLATPAHFSPNLLRLDPRWAALRGGEEFTGRSRDQERF